MTPPPIRLVCFDWGGVLLRICRGFAEGAAAAGLDNRLGGVAPELYDVRRSVSADYQVGRIDEREFVRATLDAMHHAYAAHELLAIHDAWLLGEYDGAGALVGELNDSGRVETAILSNTNERHWARRLTDFPAAGRATHQHASHVLGFKKPDPEIYRAFAEATGFAGREAEILFFDDLPENIEAARAAGWRAERIDHTGDTVAQMRGVLARLGVL